MTVSTQVVHFTKDATNNDGATQDITLNFTPKAIIVMSSGVTTNNTFADGYNAIYGFSDGTTQTCVSNVSQDMAASGNAGRTHRTDSVFCQLDPADGTTVLSRASAAFATNKVTLTWTVNDSLATYIVLVAYGGTGISNVKVATVATTVAAVGTYDYTGLGFNPADGDSVLFTLHGGMTTSGALNTQVVDAGFSFGSAISSTKRWSIACNNEDVTTTMDTDSYFVNDECLTGTFPAATGLNFEADFNSWITDGFRLDWENLAGATTTQFSYMVIKGGVWDCGNDAIPTNTEGPSSKNHTVAVSSQTLRGLLVVTPGSNNVGSGFDTAVVGTARYCVGATDGTTSCGIASVDLNGAADAVTVQISNGSGRLMGYISENTTASSSTWFWRGAFSSFGTNQFTVTYAEDVTNGVNNNLFCWVVVADEINLTSVEKTLTLRYNIEQQIVKQLILRYNLEQAITKSLTLRYDVASFVEKSLALRYDITSLVEKALILRYNLEQTIEKSLTIRYDITSLVEKSLTLRYNIDALVEKVLILRYDVNALVEKSLTLRYDIEAIGLTEVEKSLTLRYDITSLVEKSVILRYNLDQQIEQILNLRYDITSLIDKSLTTRYNIEQTIVKPLNIRYDITSLVEKVLTLRYNLEQTIEKVLTLRYDIESALTAIEKALTLRYNIEQQTEKSLITRYDIAAEVPPKSLTLRYDISSLIEKALTLRYNLEQAIEKSVNLRYHVTSLVEKPLTLRYNLEQTTEKALILRYAITTLLEKSLTARYDISQQIEKSLTARYDITSLVTKPLTLRYDIVTETIKQLTTRYNIEQQILKQLTLRYDIEAEANLVNVYVTRFQKNATGTPNATQDIAIPFTPKAIIVFSDGNTANNTVSAHYQWIQGFSDGTNHACISVVSEDAVVSSSDTYRSHRNDSVFIRRLESTGVVQSRATCAFSDNNVRFTWVQNDTAATYVTVVAYGGPAITAAKVNTVNTAKTGTGTQDYTGLDFNPTGSGQSVLFTMMAASTTSGEANGAVGSFGCATSSTARWVTAVCSEDAVTPSDTKKAHRNDACLYQLTLDGVIDGYANFNSWITDGFRLDWIDEISDNTLDFSYLVIEGGVWDCGTLAAPTTAAGSTNYTVNTADNVPKGLFITASTSTLLTNIIAHNNIVVGATDGTTQIGMSVVDIDNLATSDTYRINQPASIIHRVTTAGAISHTAVFTSFAQNQFTLNWTAADLDRYFGWVVVANAPGVLEEIAKQLTLRYDITTLIEKQVILRYDIASLVEKLLTLRYQIESVLTVVPKTLAIRYNIEAEVQKLLRLKFNIEQRIIKTLSILYDIEGRAALAERVSDPGYKEPLRCRIKFIDRKNPNKIHYTYDAFTPASRPFNLLACSVRLAQGEIGAFSFSIEDSAKTVNTDNIGYNSRVEIDVKKEGGEEEWQRLMTGYVRRVQRIRSATNTLIYTVNGYGLQIVFNERVTNFKRAAKRTQVDSPDPLPTDSNMFASTLFSDLITASDIMPLKGPSLAEQAGFTIDSINVDVKDFIAQISPGLTDATQVANALSELTGAIWGVNNEGNPFFRYPTQKHSGIIIKDDPQDTDSAIATSINMGPFDFEDSIDLAEGFANRLYVLNAVDTKSTASSSHALGYTSLTTRGIAQQFTATDNNITGAAFILSKVGEPTSADNVISGRLRGNNNNYPTGPTLATFEISFSSVDTTKSTIFVNDIKTAEGVIIPGNKYWWFLSSTSTNDSNTIRWHHDNDTTTINRFSAILPMVDQDPTQTGTQLFWTRSDKGPVYAFSTFSSVRHVLEHSDPESIDRYGLVEGIVDLPAFEDDATFQKALVQILKTSSKPKRVYDYQRITIPNRRLFMPGELITLIDSKADLRSEKNVTAEISEVLYNFDSSGNALGCKYVNLRCISFLDRVLDDYLNSSICSE